ncbi:Fip1 motif-domain-containing protein [Fomes fomentarius]|nr:Fip1 motif-domain-containing protein [Fomes fomentarius]
MDDDDSYLYGDSNVEESVKADVQTTVPQPISLDQTRSVTEGLVAKLEEQAADSANGEDAENEPVENGSEEEEDGEEEDDSEEDVEIIMEDPHARRSLDFRQNRSGGVRSTSATFSTPQKPPQPQPSLTTEYTPRERGALTKSTSTPQPASQSQTPLPPVAATPGTTEKLAVAEKQAVKDEGPDPNTLPAARAPPSHPSIDPNAPGVMDGRSILEVDLNALAEKPWRRPGSDISDWFNYGFDEISWEAYCYRRREFGELANMLKSNVVNFSGMPEDQLIALPPEVRTMVMAGATAVMAGGGGGGPGGAGMMPPGAGMNMNGGPMMNQMMNMGAMMNPMMEMGVGMGDMGMMQDGGGGGAGPQGGAQGNPEGQVGMGMGVGEGFGGGGPPGQGMMGMGMNPEFAMQVSGWRVP